MILYLDMSSLVKLYVWERGSERVRALVAEASLLATSRVSQVESRATLARKRRNGELGTSELHTALELLQAGWQGYLLIDVSPGVIDRGGSYVERYPLRALDAIHLASAALYREKAGEPITFATADQRLREAAAQEGFLVA